ncbi:hypothetical protein INR49_024102 [Caranx melampygus]|nr:hypothetical protein INR49_024102 [Caranx melampygus]
MSVMESLGSGEQRVVVPHCRQDSTSMEQNAERKDYKVKAVKQGKLGQTQNCRKNPQRLPEEDSYFPFFFFFFFFFFLLVKPYSLSFLNSIISPPKQ